MISKGIVCSRSNAKNVTHLPAHLNIDNLATRSFCSLLQSRHLLAELQEEIFAITHSIRFLTSTMRIYLRPWEHLRLVPHGLPDFALLA